MLPSLFGLKHSNRDFTKAAGWSKNNFNSAFPVSLACYMYAKNVNPVYMMLDERGALKKHEINVADLFGIDPLSDDIYYAFESDFVPYQEFVIGNLPRIDLVTLRKSTPQRSAKALHGIEVKLTALPDNSTFNLNDDKYGCEIVVRPDTIVYLALSLATVLRERPDELDFFRTRLLKIEDWINAAGVLPFIPQMVAILNGLMQRNIHLQRPLVMQPIWKTEGKTLRLHHDAFDIFVWSNFAFTKLFFHAAREGMSTIGRPARSIVWLMKMLVDYATDEKIDHKTIIDVMSYNTKNDKAFSMSGIVTQPYMASNELTQPRIKRDELKNIILGGGQNLLSPERRLDAVILGTPDLFD